MTAAEKVLEEIEGLGLSTLAVGKWGLHRPTTRFLPIIGREKGALLEKVVEEKHPKLILEVGTLVGYSAILMGMHLKKGKIISLEFDARAADVARENIKKAGLEEKIEVIVGDAGEIIPGLKGKFDMVFLDAAKEEYFEYLKLAEPKLSPHAIVVADNVKIFAKEMAGYLEYVRTSGKYESRLHDFGFDGVEVSGKL